MAGRKIARKTAHSLIERRRRSKMNEEFGMLKDMIPACAGQDMHKLAILQVGVLWHDNLMRPAEIRESGQRRLYALPGELCCRAESSSQASFGRPDECARGTTTA